MPSTIPITTALKDACASLLTEVHQRADRHGAEVSYHVVSAWARALTQNDSAMSAAAVAAQHEFSAYRVNVQWLETFDTLVKYGGDSVQPFVVTMLRYYLFDRFGVEETLWQQYSALRQRVTLEAGHALPETWGEWHQPLSAFMDIFKAHLQREEETFQLLLQTDEARELVEPQSPFAAPALGAGPDGSGASTALVLPPGVSQVDYTATLTAYLEWCVYRYGHLQARPIQPSDRSGLYLENLYVPRRFRLPEELAGPRDLVRAQLADNSLSPPVASPIKPGPPAETIEQTGRLLALGEAGMGKTTLLRHLALQQARLIQNEISALPPGQRGAGVPLGARLRLPLYLHLADYVENADVAREGLLDYLIRALAEEELRDAGVYDMVNRLIESGRCLILLDGLDAILSTHDRRMVAMRISRLAGESCATAADNRLVVTSRPAGYASAPLSGDFQIYELEPFNRADINDALMRHALVYERARQPLLQDDELQTRAEQATIRLLRVISASDRLREMVSNPLMLYMLAEHHQEGVYLSPHPVALLRVASEATIYGWRLARGPTRAPQIQEHEAVDLLSRLAYWLQTHRSSGMAAEREVADQLAATWRERHPEATLNVARDVAEQFLSQVRQHGALLAELRPRYYGFVHPLMREYFAARFLVARYRAAAGRLREHLHNPRWLETIRLAIHFVALDSPPDASDLLESAILARANGSGNGYAPSRFEDVLKRDTLFAASLLVHQVEANPDISADLARQLVRLWLFGDRDSAGRFVQLADAARRILTGLDGTTVGRLALNHALEHLEYDDEHVRAFLADALTFWPSEADIATTSLNRLSRDDSALVRRAVAQAYGHLSDLTVDAHVRLLAMVSDADVQVRRAARRTLARSGPVPDAAMDVWVRLLRDDNPSRRQLGAKVLKRVGVLPTLVVGELLGLLSDEDETVRSAAADTLATIDTLPDDALTAICRAIDTARSDMKMVAIEALARPVELPSEVIRQLAVWSRDTDAGVRLAAIRALDACANESSAVAQALEDRTDPDEDSAIRQVAIEALARKGHDSERVPHLLMHFATDADPAIKMSAATALGYLGDLDSATEEYLWDLLKDFHGGVRSAAMEAAARLGKPYERIVRRLVDMTSGDERAEIEEAARTLTSINGLPASALLALANLLPDSDEETRLLLAASLRRHSPLPAEVVHVLMDMARSATVSTEARHAAIDLLSYSLHTVPGVLETLLELIRNEDASLRAQAVDSLAHARTLPDYALETLFNLLEVDTLEARRAAAITLTALSRALPHLGWDDERLQKLANTLRALLNDIPARAVWELDTGQQNRVFEALGWLVGPYSPEVNTP